MTKPKIFGTDGIRGHVGEGWLTEEHFERLGRAVAHVLAVEGERFGHAGEQPRLVLARDTRPSGGVLGEALARGLTSTGCLVVDLGIAPSPTLAGSIELEDASAGAVISASHNPAGDNGVKLFRAGAAKIPEDLEVMLESYLTGERELPPPGDLCEVIVRDAEEVRTRYEDHLQAHLEAVQGVPLSLDDLEVVVDCAEGAATNFAPSILRDLGATVTEIGATGDGARINEGCGALHPEVLAAEVKRCGARVGLAFDGDADRVILVDETGVVHHGDAVLYVVGSDLAQRGRLSGGGVVGTVMSNLGLEVALREVGLTLERTPVGDRHVVARMLEGGYMLGGEQAGHIVVRGPGPVTGDGLLSGLHVLAIMQRRGLPLSELARPLQLFPQVLVNVRVKKKVPLEGVTELQDACRQVETTLDGQGRVLLRYSGTEPKLRIMVEGRAGLDVQTHADHLADVARRVLA